MNNIPNLEDEDWNNLDFPVDFIRDFDWAATMNETTVDEISSNTETPFPNLNEEPGEFYSLQPHQSVDLENNDETGSIDPEMLMVNFTLEHGDTGGFVAPSETSLKNVMDPSGINDDHLLQDNSAAKFIGVPAKIYAGSLTQDLPQATHPIEVKPTPPILINNPPARAMNNPRFRFKIESISALPKQDYLSDGRDLRTDPRAHLFGPDTVFGTTSDRRSSPHNSPYAELLALSPTNPNTPAPQTHPQTQGHTSSVKSNLESELCPAMTTRRIVKSAKTKGLNARRRNIDELDPSVFYQRLENIPSSWGSHENGQPVFRYNEHGGLVQRVLTVQQTLEYLYCNPRRADMTLWVQSVPADSAKRYPDNWADKCRFADCPVNTHTIHKGTFRVAFDEHSDDRKLDPYHNAGFVHLWCMEKFLDFPEICRSLNVKPDIRVLPESKNRMSVCRDHQEQEQIVNDFLTYSSVKLLSQYEDKDQWDYSKTLCYKLTAAHLELEPKNRAGTRAKQGGNHIGLHFNNLEVYVLNEAKRTIIRHAEAHRADNPKWVTDVGERSNLDQSDEGLRVKRREEITDDRQSPTPDSSTSKRKRSNDEEENSALDVPFGGPSVKRAK